MKYRPHSSRSEKQRYTRISIAIVLTLVSALALTGSTPTTAFAQHQVHLVLTSTFIPYSNYGTDVMYIDDVSAFCVEPKRKSPPTGTYTASAITPRTGPNGTTHDASLVAATLWFGEGGPGFDPSIWPSTWVDGTPMTSDDYYVATHLVAADFYLANADEALYGCDSSFKNWAKGNLLSYVNEQQPYHPDATQTKIANRIGEVPQSFIDGCFQITPSGAQTTVSSPRGGFLDLQKSSSLPEVTNTNPLYSLNGALYGIYHSQADAAQDLNRIETLTTNQEGYAKSTYHSEGTYYLRELVPSSGYALDPTVYSVQSTHAQTTRVNATSVPETPQQHEGLLLGKYDTNRDFDSAGNTAQGNAQLAGAEFSIEYYQGIYDSPQAARASATPYRSWIFATNEYGLIPSEQAEDLKIGGDALFYTTDGVPAFPLGSYVITEIKAPQGYLINASSFIVTVSSSGTQTRVEGVTPLQVPNEVIRGGVRLTKLDAESRESHPLGGAELDATFTITNVSTQPVYVQGIWYEPNEVVFTGQSLKQDDGSYVFTTDTDNDGRDTTLPYGTYQIKEILPATGYLLDSKTVTFSITNDEEVVAISPENTFTNQVKRGDIEFVKAREDTSQRLAGIPFKITSETTGEAHIAVTDENGYFSSAAQWNPHTVNTNFNDTADESTYLAEAGIWFGTTKDGTLTRPQDTLGALPYDTYSLEELPCSANEGLSLISLNGIHISRDNTVVDLGTFDNIAPYLHTTARDAIEGDKILGANADVTVNDQVRYGGLNPSESYTLHAWAIDKASKTEIPGSRVQLEFTPEAAHGSVEIRLPVTTRGISGNEVVIFEELYTQDRLVCSHTEIDDSEQTLVVLLPELDSHAINPTNEEQTLYLDPQAQIRDTVTYRNLPTGEEYILTGTLMLKHVDEQGQVQVEPLMQNDQEVSSQLSFVPDHAQGSIAMDFTVDTTALGDAEIVVYQSLTKDGELVAEHANPSAASQTLNVIPATLDSVIADASDADKLVIAQANSAVVDTVFYDNLVAGQTYTIKGQLMRAIANPDQSFSAEPFTIDGNPVETVQTITPEASSGEVEVRFDIPINDIPAPENLVAYEEVYLGDTLIASHTDPSDQDQSFVLTPEPVEPQTYDKTGNVALFTTIAGTLALAASGAAFLGYRHFARSRSLIKRITSRMNEASPL